MDIGENDILKELRTISRILTLASAKQIEAELSKIASTDDRKRMWVLIDGKNMAKDIAANLKVSERGVNYFISQVAEAGFIENVPRKPPVRSIDYVPPTWLELVRQPVDQQEVAGGEAVLRPPIEKGD